VGSILVIDNFNCL